MQPSNNPPEEAQSPLCNHLPATASNEGGEWGADLVSEEVKEIVSYRPHWLVRKGNAVLGGVLLLLLLLTLIVDYPDVVPASARLVAVNAPKAAIARKDGRLVALNAVANQAVEKGQHLAVVESTADYAEVMRLLDWLKTVLLKSGKDAVEDFTALPPPLFAALGDLQTPYQAMEREWAEHRQAFGSGYYKAKRRALVHDKVFAIRLKQTIRRQAELTKQERALQQMELAAYDSLAKDKLVAPLELNRYKTGILGKDLTLAQSDAQLINNDASVHNTQKALLDLEKTLQDQRLELHSSLLLLKSAVDAWVQQYVVTAPEAGRLVFAAPLQVNEQLAAGQELFFVQPSSTAYAVQLMAGQNGLGKVKEGQVVRLKVESYPSEEYGYLKGTVRAVSAFPNRRDSFLVNVALSQGLKTVYGKELFFRNNLSAAAEIITDNRKLFHRFFDSLKKLWAR